VNEPPTFRRVRPLHRAAPWFLAALVLTTVGLPAAAGAFGHIPAAPRVGYARPVNTTTVQIMMSDTPRFSPQFVSVASGVTAIFHLVNPGIYRHTFTVVSQPGVHLNSSWSPGQLDHYFAQNGSLDNVSVAPGGQGNATVTFNASTAFDSFEFVSVVPYQFQAGMYGFVNVTSTSAGLMTTENTSDALQFLPNVLSANAPSYPVNLDVLVTNTGNFGHTFTVVPQSNVTVSYANFTSYFVLHAPLVNVQVPAGAGLTVWANFTIPGPGIYQYICEANGHLQNGMSGVLYVGNPVPPQPGPPSTAIVQSWVLVGSAVLLGVGVLAATASMFVGRFPPQTKGSSEHP
jgi:uncharacterized cupredoxin-like copper-binding protein